jgi:hypothetical protein
MEGWALCKVCQASLEREVLNTMWKWIMHAKEHVLDEKVLADPVGILRTGTNLRLSIVVPEVNRASPRSLGLAWIARNAIKHYQMSFERTYIRSQALPGSPATRRPATAGSPRVQMAQWTSTSDAHRDAMQRCS